MRAWRTPLGPAALAAAQAWSRATSSSDADHLAKLGPELAALAHDALHPAALLTSADLEAAGVPRGPRWGELLTEAENRTLEGLLATREEALAWLRAEAGG